MTGLGSMLSDDQIRQFEDEVCTIARRVRLVADSIELPQAYQDDSFFGLQGQASQKTEVRNQRSIDRDHAMNFARRSSDF